MKARTTHDYLLELKALLQKERQEAIQLKTDDMLETIQEKKRILDILAHVKEIDAADKPLAKQIRKENLRNAYLYKSTLKWIRGTMDFFGSKVTTTTYSPEGESVTSEVHGKLLSGKV